jgi:hypothetical protein
MYIETDKDANTDMKMDKNTDKDIDMDIDKMCRHYTKNIESFNSNGSSV